MGQPIIRGIQSVGAVDIKYKYNSADGALTIPSSFTMGDNSLTSIDTSNYVDVAGFRLDGEFLRANPQIASSIVIPILGGGGVALTNNNRTGTLTLNCAKVSTPDTSTGAMYKGTGVGPKNTSDVFDMVFLAQLQQAQEGGDSTGADIVIEFMFCGYKTTITFEACTVATVDPLGLTGNDAASYSIVFNYLNWTVAYSSTN